MEKNRFFAKHSKSSAMVVSLAIHAVLALVAVSFVAVKVIVKEEPEFESKRVKRPKMPPKKIQVPVNVKKRKPKPRLRKRIVTTKTTFNEIKMPEITGVAGGLGNMGGDGLGSLGFELDIGDLFGGNKSRGNKSGGNESMGNELTGTFYDLKQTKYGKPNKMDANKFYEELASFTRGWNLNRLNKFYHAPKNKYATFFMIPTIKSAKVTEAFGVSETVTALFWAAYYEGHISVPEDGFYRFWGYGDDILLVRINKRLVIDASYLPRRPELHTGWMSDDENDQKYPIGANKLYVGDWFKLTKGKPVKMEVLLGDVGNISSFQLLIEKKGMTYKEAPYSYNVGDHKISGTRPILPVFKTREIPKELHGEMKINPKQATLEGPTFGAVGE